MTQDEIMAMWNSVIKYAPSEVRITEFAKLVRNHYSYTHAHLWLTRIEGAVKAEREACAKLIDDMANQMVEDMEPSTAIAWVRSKAAAIRARGEQA